MPIISFQAENTIQPQLKDFNQRLTTPSYKNILLKGEVYDLGAEKYSVIFRPLIFPFHYLGAIGIVGTTIINSWQWTNWNFISIFLMLSYVFYNSRAMYVIFALGMRRQGYKGELKYLDVESAMEELLKDGTKRYIGVPQS